MSELLTAAQMRDIEKAAIDSGEVTGLELMERAGRGAVEAIFEEWPEMARTSNHAVVLCGPGNNGGDGFVVARLLKERGWEVDLFLYGDPSNLPQDAWVNLDRWTKIGAVNDLLSAREAFSWNESPDSEYLIIDALFGSGLNRGFSLDLAFALIPFWRPIPYRPIRCVAVDMPSGYCSDSGAPLMSHDGVSSVYECDLCVTFEHPKLGHYIGEASQRIGSLRTSPIGLSAINDRAEKIRCGRQFPQKFVKCVVEEPEIEDEAVQKFSKNAATHGVIYAQLCSRLLFPDLLFKSHPFSHKYSYGHALVLSGPPGKGGAARMAARGALRIGAGLVTVACPPGALQENASRLDAIMLQSLKGDSQAAALAEVLQDDRINALCLGPGLGLDDRAESLLACVLQAEAPDQARGGEALPVPGFSRNLDRLDAEAAKGPGSDSGRAIVLDADALTILSYRADLFACLNDNCVLTPHEGEFKRLFPDIHAKLVAPATKGPAYSKVDATREAAARTGCVVLFKGPDTVIADPHGRASINSAHYDRAAPWLATAGSGDVLAGFITGLLARGFTPTQAAETAAWLHVECALSFGPGLIAEDIPEELPKVFRALEF